tara:strand:- start:28577 stop:29884 length:1308 start_codon:yes stop_codon:yes gene_type:complete
MTKVILKNIESRKAKIAIIGLGYIGLPICISFLKAGFKVFGIDNDRKKISNLIHNKSYLSTIKSNLIKENSKNFFPTHNFREINNSDIVIVCVPTPITYNKKPNLKYVEKVVNQIQENIKKNQIIILECTSYPGTTEEYFLPLFKKKKLTVGKDIFLGYSPEREDPGNLSYSIVNKNMPKIIAGYTKRCSKLIFKIYSFISKKLFITKDIRTAEFTKLLENIYRSINIGLSNELHEVCKKMNIDYFAAINAAKTKPFGFQPFYPGPGVGGHCVPVDPYYLSHKAKQYKANTKFISLAGKINDARPKQVANEIIKVIDKKKFKKLLLIGVSYKKNVDDIRGTPILEIHKIINKKRPKLKISLCDPLVDNLKIPRLKKLNFVKLKKLKSKIFLQSFDLGFIGTNHDIFDYNFLSKNLKFILDSRYSFSTSKDNIKII